MTGAVAGAGVGLQGLPAAWRGRLAEWPHTVDWMIGLSQTLAAVRVDRVGTAAPSVSALKLLARNLCFMIVVLLHGFRRLLPPY